MEELAELDDRELIRRFQQEKDERALGALLKRHEGLIHGAKRRVAGRAHWLMLVVSDEDVESWARGAFADGIRDLDLTYPVKLSTYMVPYLKKIRQELFRYQPIRFWNEADKKPWLLPAYRQAKSELNKEGKPGTLEEFQSKMLDWVKARGGHPKRLAYLTEKFNSEPLRSLALTDELLGHRFLQEGIENETGRGSWSELAGLKRASLDDALNILLERELLGRLIEQLPSDEGEVLRLYVELEPDETKKSEPEEIIGRIAQELGKEPQQISALLKAAQRRARATVGRWLREGALSEEEIRNREFRRFFLVEEQIAALADAAGGALGLVLPRASKSSKMTKKKGRSLAVAYLNELKEGGPKDQADFLDYRRRLTPQCRETIELLLAEPGDTQKELGAQMGKSRELVRIQLDRAFQTLMFLAVARREGPDSFEALIWRASGRVGKDWRSITRALLRAGIRDRGSLLALRAGALPRYLREARFREGLLEFLAEERAESMPGQAPPQRELPSPELELPEAGPVPVEGPGVQELLEGDRSV